MHFEVFATIGDVRCPVRKFDAEADAVVFAEGYRGSVGRVDVAAVHGRAVPVVLSSRRYDPSTGVWSDDETEVAS